MSNDFDLPDIEDLSSGQSGIAVEEDTKLLAVKFGIIGAGQAGSRMVDTFYSLGYRRVCAINTTAQDFLGLELPVNRQLVLTTKGGAGKDQGQGQEAVEKGSESVFNLMRASFGDDIDRIMITSSLGGGCVAPTSMVLTSSGLMTAGSILDSYAQEVPCDEGDNGETGFALTEELNVASMRADGIVEWKPLERVWSVPAKPAIKISTRFGHLTCSENHPVFVYNSSTDTVVEKLAKDLSVNDVLVHYKGQLEFGVDYNKDKLWLLGYFAGNGNFKWRKDGLYSTPTKINVIRFYDASEENLLKAKELCLEFGASSVAISKSKTQASFEVYAYGQQLIDLFVDAYGPLRPIKGNLVIPEFVYDLNKKSFLAYLAGVHSADGYVRPQRNSIDLTMVDLVFVESLRDLCNAHGIKCTYSVKTSVRKNERPLGRLRIFAFDNDTKASFCLNLTEALRKEFGDSETAMPIGYTSNSIFPIKYDQIERLFKQKPKYYNYANNVCNASYGRFEDEFAPLLKDECLLKKIYGALFAIDAIEKLSAIEFVDFTVYGNSNYFAGNGALTLVHNSGSGGILPLIKKAVRYMEEIGKEPKIGLIVALPKKSEGGKAQSNAYLAMQKIKVLLETKEISPCVIVDNDVIQNMLGAVSAKSFWQVANKQILGLFDVFNILAAQKSSYVTFDRADYTTMLESGLITFGSTKLLSYEKDTDLSDGLRLNLERTMLTEVDLTKSTHLAAILCAPEKILSLLPQSHIDLAFSTLERILQGENRSFTIHQGVYESSRNGIYCYTMAGGFPIPEKRLAIMKVRGGLA